MSGAESTEEERSPLNDDELPGMWERADFLGGAPDLVRGAESTEEER